MVLLKFNGLYVYDLFSFHSCFNHDEHLYYNLTIYSSKVNKKYYVIANHQDPVESRYNCLKNFKDKKMAINFAKNKMKEIKSLSVYI